MKFFKKLLLSFVVAIGLVGVSTVTQAQEVEAAQGYIMASGNLTPGGNNIVGVWVEVQGGQSGWAHRTPTTPGQNYSISWIYNTQNRPFQLHVGVGGTPQNWARSVKTGWIYNYRDGTQFNIVGNTITMR